MASHRRLGNGNGPRRKINDDELPASFRSEHGLVLPSQELDTFIDHDFAVKRVDGILQHLWLAGRPYPPRPLSVQNVLNRTTVPTNDASLHLVWASGKIFLKPLPRYALSESFYEQYLAPAQPHALALGLTFTYLALVPTELDFALARESHLFPPGYKWSEWKALVARVLKDYPDNAIYRHVHLRYVYGELRHDRLDKIHRYFLHDWLHGFSPLMGTSTYGEFLMENLGPIATGTVYIILVLTAMQVVLARESLAGQDQDGPFARASYVFAIFALVAPVAAVAVIMGALLAMLVANWSRTTVAKRTRFKELGLPNTLRAKRSRGAADLDTVDLVQFSSVSQNDD